MSLVISEIEALVFSLQEAWNQSDATKFAGHFAKDADFIHILGGQGAGRESIQHAHARIFETIYRDSEISYTIEGVRLLAPTTAVVRIFQTLKYGLTNAQQTMHCRPTVVVQKTTTGWEIVAMQNTRVAEPEDNKKADIIRGHPFAPKVAQG